MGIYFLNALTEIVAEFFAFSPVIYITKPLIPFILMLLYYVASTEREVLFFITMFFSAVTNLLFIPKSEQYLFYGIIAFTIHRVLMLIFIFKILKNIKIIPLVLTTIPLILIFFYLFIESAYVPANSFYILIFQIILIAIFGGAALSSYIIEDSRENSYLMICGLLFVGLQLVLYVEKYFLYAIPIISLRPIAMSLNVLAFFSFYKYVIVAEETKQ